MRVSPKSVLPVILLLASLSLIAQTTRHPKTLLWRISGNGLQSPSYLFGTMHLNDERLFHFTDSVYKAIEKCDGLAIEINPDELGAYYVTKAFDDLEKGKQLSSVLSKSDFNKYSHALSKKLKKPAEEITTKDIVKEKNKWLAEYFEKGEQYFIPFLHTEKEKYSWHQLSKAIIELTHEQIEHP